MYSGGCCSVENLNDMADEMDPNTYHYYKDAYNDLNIAFDKNILDQLIEGGKF